MIPAIENDRDKAALADYAKRSVFAGACSGDKHIGNDVTLPRT